MLNVNIKEFFLYIFFETYPTLQFTSLSNRKSNVISIYKWILNFKFIDSRPKNKANGGNHFRF